MKLLPLPPLDGHDQFKDNALYQQHADVRRMVAEMNGHPQGLHYLREILQTWGASHAEAPSHADLNARLAEQFRGVMTVAIPPELVEHCLLGTDMWLDESASSEPGALKNSFYVHQVFENTSTRPLLCADLEFECDICLVSLAMAPCRPPPPHRPWQGILQTAHWDPDDLLKSSLTIPDGFRLKYRMSPFLLRLALSNLPAGQSYLVSASVDQLLHQLLDLLRLSMAMTSSS